MPNGKLRLYNKLTNAQLVELDITGIFNIEDNLNDQPSNAKFKVVTDNTYREEFEVNTVCYHADTNTWWVIKSDESTYLHTGEYEHEISVVEYLEWYSYKHLPNCAFAPSTYSLEQMLERLFRIAKLTNVQFVFPAFLDKDKIMPFMSFENFTVANAIKNIGRAINAIPKAYVDISSGYQPKLTFVNRSGLDTEIKSILNDWFPTAYEKNLNSSDQFTTRSVSNIQNAKSSNPITSPLEGGYNIFTPNNFQLVNTNARVSLPSKIDSVAGLNVYVPIYLTLYTNSVFVANYFYGYYLSKSALESAIDGIGALTAGEKTTAKNALPTPSSYYTVNTSDVINTSYTSNTATMFKNKLVIKSKFDFDLIDDTAIKERTAYWIPFGNEIVMPKSIADGLTNNQDHNNTYVLFDDGTDKVVLRTDSPKVNTYLVQAIYFPIADIKVSIDNSNDAQDEKYYNQQGKVIDALSVTKLITAHTNDSVEGTKIRNARYGSPDYDYTDILPLGQIVRDGNQLYVISQRSIDATIKDGNEYYNVVYTLTKNRIGRSENIVADSAVINYKIPDDNLVFRTQLYKDYIEFSLVNENQDTPYLAQNKMITFSNNLAGSNFDFNIFAKNDYGTSPTTVRYVRNGTIYDLHKSKLININWQDNNILGFNVDLVSGTYVQTPISYTDSLGKATNFQVLFLTKEQLASARTYYNANYTPVNQLIPYDVPNNINNNFYTNSILTTSPINYQFKIDEPNYAKDPFEIPVFEYMIQINDNYSPNGNIVVGNDIFARYETAPVNPNTMRYHFVPSSTRFTAENALSLYNANPPSSSTNKRVTINISGTNNEIYDLFFYTTFSGTLNTTAFTNVGIFATDGVQTPKFLFAINDYVQGGINNYSAIRLFLNNWKI